MKKFTIISLGCPKNTVDSEVLKGSLKQTGYDYCEDVNSSDVVIINTCGFIKDAKEESIETILEAINLKEDYLDKKIIAMGCLTERYKTELSKEFVELDGIFGVDSQEDIVKYLTMEKFEISDIATSRDLITSGYTAYLKVSEGCDNRCAFCAIPDIRGLQKSRKIDEILREAEYLHNKGVKEIILTAQDLTRYGHDNYGQLKLYDLVQKIAQARFFPWIRIMYTNPDYFHPQLLELFTQYKEICPYIDIPIQHASDRILKLMNRKKSSKEITKLISTIRKEVPNIALRTSLITGFPTESENDFGKLLDFVEEMRFERLGVFTYSEEEDTKAALLDDDVPEDKKHQRQEILMKVQFEVGQEFANKKNGTETTVLIENKDNDHYIGRTMWDAPEVDCFAVVKSKKDLQIGEFYKMEITGNLNIDLTGEIN